MALFFSLHAVDQSRSRKITRAEAQEVLSAGNKTQYPSEEREDALVTLGETEGGRRLKVVTKVSDPDYVITLADRDNEE